MTTNIDPIAALTTANAEIERLRTLLDVLPSDADQLIQYAARIAELEAAIRDFINESRYGDDTHQAITSMSKMKSVLTKESPNAK